MFTGTVDGLRIELIRLNVRGFALQNPTEAGEVRIVDSINDDTDINVIVKNSNGVIKVICGDG